MFPNKKKKKDSQARTDGSELGAQNVSHFSGYSHVGRQKKKQMKLSADSYTFTETSEALSSGPLLVQHGIDLVQRVRQLAESLH